MPKVSVIVPTYNREHYVTKAIDSILEQTFEDHEVIVVDDGSVDRTRAALRQYGSRIRYIYQHNAGVSAARNTGIAAATGEWIAYLDSDDEWMSGYLAEQMESVERFPEAVAHVANSISILPQEPRLMAHFDTVGILDRFAGSDDPILVKKPFRTIVSSSHWFLQPIVMRRQVLLESGLFNPELTIAEDMDVVARLALKGPFSFNRSVLVQIYRRPEATASLSAQFMNRGIYSRKAFGRVFSDLLTRPELTLTERAALCRALCELWRAIGNLYLMSEKQSKAREAYRMALRLYPSLKALLKYFGTLLPQQFALQLVRKRLCIVPGDDLGDF